MRTFVEVSQPEVLPVAMRRTLDGTVVSDAVSLTHAIVASHEHTGGTDGNSLGVDALCRTTGGGGFLRARVYCDDGSHLCFIEIFVDAHRIVEG